MKKSDTDPALCIQNSDIKPIRIHCFHICISVCRKRSKHFGFFYGKMDLQRLIGKILIGIQARNGLQCAVCQCGVKGVRLQFSDVCLWKVKPAKGFPSVPPGVQHTLEILMVDNPHFLKAPIKGFPVDLMGASGLNLLYGNRSFRGCPGRWIRMQVPRSIDRHLITLPTLDLKREVIGFGSDHDPDLFLIGLNRHRLSPPHSRQLEPFIRVNQAAGRISHFHKHVPRHQPLMTYPIMVDDGIGFLQYLFEHHPVFQAAPRIDAVDQGMQLVRYRVIGLSGNPVPLCGKRIGGQ